MVNLCIDQTLFCEKLYFIEINDIMDNLNFFVTIGEWINKNWIEVKNLNNCLSLGFNLIELKVYGEIWFDMTSL